MSQRARKRENRRRRNQPDPASRRPLTGYVVRHVVVDEVAGLDDDAPLTLRPVDGQLWAAPLGADPGDRSAWVPLGAALSGDLAFSDRPAATAWVCLDCGSRDLHEGPNDPPPWCCCMVCGSSNVGPAGG